MVVLFSLVCADLAVTVHEKIAIILRIILIKVVKLKIKVHMHWGIILIQ